MKIIKQSKQFGSLGWKNSGFWRDHYTMSLWKSREDIQNFYRNGAHAESMKRSSQMSTEIATLTIEASEFLSWKEAKQRIHAEGKKIYFS